MLLYSKKLSEQILEEQKENSIIKTEPKSEKSTKKSSTKDSPKKSKKKGRGRGRGARSDLGGQTTTFQNSTKITNFPFNLIHYKK